MTNKKKRRTNAKPVVQLPAGSLQSGLAKRTAQRHLKRIMFAGFEPLSSAFDEVLAQLRVLSEADGLDAEMVHLLSEAQQWIIDGVDRSLADSDGEIEESRRLLELEYLLRDFAASPDSIHEWASIESWRRQSKFGFGELRKREEKRQGLSEDQVVAARDYWILHSIYSHPKPLADVLPSSGDQSRALLSLLGDLLGHAISLVDAAKACVEAQGCTIPTEFEELSTTALDESWARMREALHSHIPTEALESLRRPRPRKGS